MNYTKRFRVRPGKHLSLSSLDPADTGDVKDKSKASSLLERGVAKLAEMQDRLYAQDTWAVLIVLQGMDAAGKDSLIKHVMRGVNPQGCRVVSFKAPSAEELDHDYLWRSTAKLPERGQIGIHNRSHYEEVVITRVHPEILARQKLPETARGKDIWQQRFRQITRWERHLVENGTLVLKFFLHLSKDEQRRRFLKRMDEPEKHWKFRPDDVRERAYWPRYMAAYEDAISHTSTGWAPWFVVPADHKWFTRLAVAEIMVAALETLDLQYPKVSKSARREWQGLRAQLGGAKG